jgi:hypothetical protein
MTTNDPIVVKRQYLKPIPHDPIFEQMKKGTNDYRTKVRQRKCLMCDNPATQMLCSDMDGITLFRKYCDNCIKENKHVQQEERF